MSHVLVGHFCDYLGRIETKVKTIRGGLYVFGLYHGGIFSREAYSLGGAFYKFPTEDAAKAAFDLDGDSSAMALAQPYAVFDEFGYTHWAEEELIKH